MQVARPNGLRHVKASIVITTKDRKEELPKALASCFAQASDCEVIVIDDGSSDGTSDMVRADFPDARLITHQASAGLIARRNEGAAVATGDIIFSIDDDAEFSTPEVVPQTLHDFDEPTVAVVAIPLVEPRYGNRQLQFAPDPDGVWITDTFKGTAYAVRRDIFLKTGGFRADLIHQGEESDFAIRLMDKGFFIRIGRADPIVHYESPKRDLRRTHYYGRRNDVLFAFRNAPREALLRHALGTTWNGVRFMAKTPSSGAMVRGLLAGWTDGIRLWGTRSPVQSCTYRRFRQLRSAGSLLFEDL